MSEPRLTFALMSAMISGGEAELVEFEVCCIKYKKGAKFLAFRYRESYSFMDFGGSIGAKGFRTDRESGRSRVREERAIENVLL